MTKKYNRTKVFTKEGILLPIEERTFITNEGYSAVIIDGGSKPSYVTIQIEDYVFEMVLSHVKRGGVRYPFHPSVFNKGYLGIGAHKANENNKKTKAYDTWKNMLKRSYDSKFHIKQPTYKDVEVCEEWLNFQTFSKWFEQSNYQNGWELDKDLLSVDNKIYSPETCLFIPQALNKFLSNSNSANTSGYTGVSWAKHINKWRVFIQSVETGEGTYLGCFIDIEEAGEAYKVARVINCNIWRERMSNILPYTVINNIN